MYKRQVQHAVFRLIDGREDAGDDDHRQDVGDVEDDAENGMLNSIIGLFRNIDVYKRQRCLMEEPMLR